MLLPKFAIFDLDGVLVDTAKYHYMAWKEIANELGLNFSIADNEKLKGVSRDRSLDIILEINNSQNLDLDKSQWLARKNEIYLSYIEKLSESDLLPGVIETISLFKEQDIKMALGSASKNAIKILKTTGIFDYFDAVVDGNSVTNAKPDPEVFLIAAQKLYGQPAECVVFEDAIAGVNAALSAGMKVIAIGDEAQLGHANKVVKDMAEYLNVITNKY
ncbi:beta-phosphoglucomutase [Vibrio sp. DNB22_10_4]